jgi:hypothetical protein
MLYGRMIVNSEMGEIWEKEFVTWFVVLFLKGLMNTTMQT